ncbi:MAG: hemin uptake protein HemP [Planctomycetales bacterium]|nr:hemin uptake protein HemP [Planctomycetales bacterium]
MTNSNQDQPSAPKHPSEPREVSSDELLRGARSLVITHAGERYRLLVTRNGKLMLQK